MERPEQRRAAPAEAPAETPVEAPAVQKPAVQKPAAARRPKAAVARPQDLSGQLPELGPDTAPGLDKRTAARLRRGQLPVEARIDLHGLTRDEAHQALEAFLKTAHDAGKRCVLVITGKGLRAPGEMGVLRDAVPRWLNAPPIRPLILAF
ncbi:MAG: Smr/MutS family protein, partial [Alphaproteobacteria bacterium]